MPSIFYARFILDGETLDYVDIRGQMTEEQYNQILLFENKIPFTEFCQTLNKKGYIKYLSSNIDEEKAKTIFGQNIATYFPSYRFEYPGYLNTTYKNEIKFDCEGKFTGYLLNPIEVITDLPNLANWIMDVILDDLIYNKNDNVEKDEQNNNQLMNYGNFEILKSLNSIINETLKKNNQAGTIRLGISQRSNPLRRISVMIDYDNEQSEQYYPSIFNVSAGEASIITLFGEILHQADVLRKKSDISGIVVIDEVDKHLHIKIQKEVLPKLFDVFPNIQFILSSHSPFVSMGLNEQLSSRSKEFYLSNGVGLNIDTYTNPLYEEVYQMMLHDNENYKKLYESLKISSKPNKLLVEDSYVQIYKIAWLKLKDISFNENNLESVFQQNSEFEILGGLSCNGVAGVLNSRSIELYNGMKIIGLFDYDEDGSEKFYCLKEGFIQKEILGNLTDGFYKIKKIENNESKMFALILPVPERLHSLIARSQNIPAKIWDGDAKFSNYVEIESLLSDEYMKNNNAYECNKIFGIEYYKAKDEKKKNLWKDLVLQSKEIFNDFIPLFKIIYHLFDLGEFKIKV